MKISLIAAVSDNDVIGVNNNLPWRISADLKRFSELTKGHPVIMGRKTYDSLPDSFKPLPDRKNIILSRTFEKQNGIYIAKNIGESLNLAEGQDTYIIGGGEIYKTFLPMADELELTRVNKIVENGDTFFPKVNWDNWELANEEKHETKKGLEYSFLTYARK